MNFPFDDLIEFHINYKIMENFAAIDVAGQGIEWMAAGQCYLLM